MPRPPDYFGEEHECFDVCCCYFRSKLSYHRNADHAVTLPLLFLQAKLETKALKAKRPGFTDDRYKETAYYVENGEIFSSAWFRHRKSSMIICNVRKITAVVKDSCPNCVTFSSEI